jgi:hypothetical protein
MVESVFDHNITPAEAVLIGAAGSEEEWSAEAERVLRVCVDCSDQENSFFVSTKLTPP